MDQGGYTYGGATQIDDDGVTPLTGKYPHLKEGSERFFITDINNPASSASAQSDMPIMWDKLATNVSGGVGFNHVPGGCNTLYMDGHVEFVKLGEDFPATPENAPARTIWRGATSS